MTHPILQKGDIIFAGSAALDREEERYHLEYIGERSSRSIVPKDALGHMQRLGIELSEHWDRDTAQKGHMASANVRYRHGPADVSPHITHFLEVNLTNHHIKHLLEAEY